MMTRIQNMTKLLTAAAVMASGAALAQGAMDAEKAERCATRLSIAFQGKSADAALLASADPQGAVDAMLSSADFIERFSRFINAQFNDEPGVTSVEDSAYHLMKYLLQNNRPYEELFLGAYDVDVVNGAVVVSDDANGLGYFRSVPWMKRYAGNEEAGIRISTAYRMMQNTVGLRLVASTNAPGADISATGRQAAGCRACHYDSWFGLDKTAEVLGKVRRPDDNTVVFDAPTAGPQQILGGLTISDDKELVTALVKSEAFKFRACRLVFEFLYGRPESTCEGPVFDACMQEFTAKGTMQAALAVVAKDETYCQ